MRLGVNAALRELHRLLVPRTLRSAIARYARLPSSTRGGGALPSPAISGRTAGRGSAEQRNNAAPRPGHVILLFRYLLRPGVGGVFHSLWPCVFLRRCTREHRFGMSMPFQPLALCSVIIAARIVMH